MPPDGYESRRREGGSRCHRARVIYKTYETKAEGSMKLKPLGDRVVVKAAEAEEQTKSGLFIPDTAKEKPQKGSVVAVGDGKFNDKGERNPVDVKVGDVVIYGKYSAQEFKIDGEEYLILRADDIYAIVQGK
jgi:chaperonin GroES